MKTFINLRDFLQSKHIKETDELYFAYSATLRISGEIEDLNDITELLSINPTHTHKKDEKRSKKSQPYRDDMWMYSPNISEEKHLSEHITELWNSIKPKKDAVLKLKEKYDVDIFLGYRSNCDHAGIEVPYSCLEMFIELQIPFGISVIIA
jgi:hypothetical protein